MLTSKIKFRQISLADDIQLSDDFLKRLALFSEFPLATVNLIKPSAKAPAAQTDCLIATWRTPLNAATLARFPNLKLINLRATDMSNVDKNYTKQQNITVKNISDYADFGTAEFVIHTLLSVQRQRDKGQLPFEVHHKRLGLIGLGKVGRLVAKAATGLNMNVRYYSPSASSFEKREKAENISYCPLAELIETSDFLSFHNPAYTKVMSADLWKCVPKKAVLIVTTLGLPFELADFQKWISRTDGRAIFDQCAAFKFKRQLQTYSNVSIAEGYAGRTPESVIRAENALYQNILDFLNTKPYGKRD